MQGSNDEWVFSGVRLCSSRHQWMDHTTHNKGMFKLSAGTSSRGRERTKQRFASSAATLKSLIDYVITRILRVEAEAPLARALHTPRMPRVTNMSTSSGFLAGPAASGGASSLTLFNAVQDANQMWGWPKSDAFMCHSVAHQINFMRTGKMPKTHSVKRKLKPEKSQKDPPNLSLSRQFRWMKTFRQLLNQSAVRRQIHRQHRHLFPAIAGSSKSHAVEKGGVFRHEEQRGHIQRHKPAASQAAKRLAARPQC